MICLSFFSHQYQQCKGHLSKGEFIELRLDESMPNKEELKEIMALDSQIIATCRRGKRTDGQRKKILMEMIGWGIDYLDLDIITDGEFIPDIKKYAREKSVKLILSYHNFSKTPANIELMGMVKRVVPLAPQVVKIATKINQKRDIFNILSLYDRSDVLGTIPIIALGMGNMGRITRIAAPLLGSPFTYATIPGIQQTADGQLNYNIIRDIYEHIS